MSQEHFVPDSFFMQKKDSLFKNEKCSGHFDDQTAVDECKDGA